jgi:tetratricopeptide (TPR) repeat protein
MSTKVLLRWLRIKAWLLLAFGRRDDALVCFNTMLKLDSRHALALASRAHLAMSSGQPAAALDDLRRLTQITPDDAVPWFNLGFVLQAQDAHDEAVAALTEATRCDPKLDRAWYGLGLSLLTQNRLDEAIAAFKRNTELQPMSPYGWTQLARAWVRAEQPQRARKAVEHLRGFEPKVAEALARELRLDASA